MKTILVNVVKNPLLQGAMVGLVFFFLGIHVPKSLLTPIAAFADATSPVALFVLGGTLHFNAIRGNLKYLVPALSLKLLVLPAVMLALGYAFGLRDLELFLLVAIYGTPVAAASYPMAQNMGGDGELAGQFVVISTVVAVGTLFGWIFFMKSVGLISSIFFSTIFLIRPPSRMREPFSGFTYIVRSGPKLKMFSPAAFL